MSCVVHGCLSFPLSGVGGNLVAVQASRLSTSLHRFAKPGKLPESAIDGCPNVFSSFCGTGRRTYVAAWQLDRVRGCGSCHHGGCTKIRKRRNCLVFIYAFTRFAIYGVYRLPRMTRIDGTEMQPSCHTVIFGGIRGT